MNSNNADVLDALSVEIYTRWHVEHLAGAERHTRLAASASTKRDIKKHTEQAEMHRTNAEGCAARLALHRAAI
jgi:hypothetical protein